MSSSTESGSSPASRQADSQTKAKARAGETKAKAKADAQESPEGATATQGQAANQTHAPRIAAPKGSTEQAPTPEQVANATLADMTLQSPVIVASAGSPGTLPATYTCDGKGSWPQLRWLGVPADTGELILYAMSVQPVQGQLFVDWALAGLDPGLTGVEAGKLPKGAVVGTNGFGKRGYEICPTGSGEIYMFAIYALPRALSPPKGFDARELRKEILDVSGNVGLLPAVYARG